MFIHQPLLVVINIVRCRIHPGGPFFLGLSFHNFLLQALLDICLADTLLVVLQRDVIDALGLLHVR